MAMQLEEKKAIVVEVNGAASTALSAVVADYRGMTVSQMTRLRVRARDANVYIKVVRNTLARRAVEGTEFECLREALAGPSLLVLSRDDPGAGARLLKDFGKETDKLQVRAIALGGRLMGPEQLEAVASLPTRNQALAMLLGVMKAPVAKLARTLNEIPAKLVRTLAAVRDKKEASG